MTKTAIIFGSGGAIGSAMVENLSQNSEIDKIIAFSSSGKEFASDKVISKKIDINNEDSIANCAKEIKELKPQYAIVATGFLHDEEIMPEKSMRELNKEKFEKLYAINAIAPAIIAKYFLPIMDHENGANFAAISARVGSISDNHLGGWYSYRASKAALNMILKNLAIETARKYKKSAIIGLHPGTVDSSLSKPFQGAVAKEKLFTAEFSAKKLLEIALNASQKQSGKIFAYDGKEIEY